MLKDALDKSGQSQTIIDRILIPVVIIVFCSIAFWLTTDFERVPPILKRGIQPSDFPQLVIGLIVALAIIEIAKKNPEVPEKLNRTTWLTIGLLFGFVLVAQIDIFLALGSFAFALALLWGERRVLTLIFIGLALPAAVFFFFDLIFEVRFPRGLITSLWYG